MVQITMKGKINNYREEIYTLNYTQNKVVDTKNY